MTFTRSLRRPTAALGAVACIAAGSLTLALAAPAGAGTVRQCSGDQVFNWQTEDIRLSLVRNGDTLGSRVVELQEPLAPGTYDVETMAYDGFIGRSVDEPFEDSESYYIELLDEAGETIVHTGPTPDLADGVDEVEQHNAWTVTIDRTATAFRLMQYAYNFDGPNDLVSVGCVAVSLVPPPTTPTTEPTTTAPPTTDPPLTPVTEPPTTAPPTTAAPTTAAPVAVSSETVAAPARTLPHTGPRAGQLVTLGALLLGAGGALVVRARRLA